MNHDLESTAVLEPQRLARLARIGLTPDAKQRLMAALPTLETTLETSLGPTPEAAPQAAPDAVGAARTLLARVTEVHRDSLILHDGDTALTARQLPALRHELEAGADALAVGDWVVARRQPDGGWWVTWRLPPLTQIARRLHDGRDKVTRSVIVSNVDTVLVVMGLDGDFNLRRLERYLALVRAAGVAGVVVLTKADACPDLAARLAAVRRVTPPGVDSVAVDAREPSARDALRPWLAEGQTLVAIGSSGAGKSTLTNTLTTASSDATGADTQPAGGTAPGLTDVHAAAVPQPTGATRKGDGRGRHTTTARSLHRTPEGACLIDTPGVRTLRLDVDAADLDQAFDDVAALAPRCRFRDCRHEDEPGCAVREAVAPERLRNFHKLLREARRDTMTVLERKAEVAVWKARSKAARSRNDVKRR